MLDPESISPGSIMPAYPWLFSNKLDHSDLKSKIEVLQLLGTPYPQGFADAADKILKKQAKEVADRLTEEGVKYPGVEEMEIVALIAYLQRLGTDIKK